MKEMLGIFHLIAKSLASNREAMLPFGLCFMTPALILAETPVEWACGTPITFYVLYCVRKINESRSSLAQAELEIKKLEFVKRQELVDRLNQKKANRSENRRRSETRAKR